MKQTYFSNLEDNVKDDYFDYGAQVVMIHDPQPLGLIHYLKEKGQSWLWRCHIDIGETVMDANPSLWGLVADSLNLYDAAFFSAAQYVKERWPVPKFIIPPFIDPFSEKNRHMEQGEIDEVLAKYEIDPSVPLIAQIGRFDPWKGIDRTIATFRRVRRHKKCQLLIAGGQADDDPEGVKMLAKIREETKDDADIRILNLPLEPRLANHREVNALQRAASVIMQPSTREGFGLVVTEALWKGKPVISADVGAISLQIKEGHNGFFYQNPYQAEMKVLRLLSDHELAKTIGEHGRQYVMEHFLMPDRVADYLKSIELTLDSNSHRKLPSDIVVSFRSWYKLGRKKRGQS
jgi:trehalose synthase